MSHTHRKTLLFFTFLKKTLQFSASKDFFKIFFLYLKNTTIPLMALQLLSTPLVIQMDCCSVHSNK